MKKILSVAMILAMLLSGTVMMSPSAEGETYLLYQAGMDFGSSLFNDTILWQNTAGNYVTGTEAINGRQSFKYTPNAAGWQLFGGSSASEFTMNDGGIYTIAFKYRSTDIYHLHMAQHNNGNWARDSYLQIDAGYGNTLDSLNILSSYYLDCGTYKYIEYSFKATTGPNTYFQLEANALSANASLTIDDFSIYMGNNVPAYERPNGQELIAGSSFENGFGSYQTRYDSALLGTVDDSTARLISKTLDVLNGKTSVKAGYPNTFSTSWAGLLTVPLTNCGGWATYTAKFRAKVLQNTSGFFYLMLDAAGAANDMYVGMDSNLQPTWLEKQSKVVQYKVEPDTNGSIVTVSFMVDYDVSFDSFFIGANGGGYLSIDDIALYRGDTAPSYAAGAPVTQNAAPSVSPEEVNFSVIPGETYNGSINITDADDSTFTYTYDSQTAMGDLTVAPDGKSFTYAAHIDAEGTEQIIVTASDGIATTEFTVNVTFEVVPTVLLGDADLNGKIDICDILVVKSHILNAAVLTGDALTAADVDQNNTVDILDIVAIRNHIINKVLISNV